MDAPISIWGVETNNLKNIDVQLVPNAINLLIGPSGSGKSSLAYDTIAQIGYHECEPIWVFLFINPKIKSN